MCILKNLEKITFKEKWVLNVTTAKLIFVVHRKKKKSAKYRSALFVVRKNLHWNALQLNYMEILLRILAGAEQLFLWNSARPQKIFGVSERLNKVRGDSYGSTVTESEASGISPHLCHQKESSPLKRNFLAMLCSKHKSCQYYGIPITKWKNSQKMNKGEWESMSILPEDGTCCYFQQQKKYWEVSICFKRSES